MNKNNIRQGNPLPFFTSTEPEYQSINQASVIFDNSDHPTGLCALSITLNNGSADETAENNGVSHFIEHLVFKGTQKYTCEELSRLTERLGGYINAYTTKEQTTFYIKGFAGNAAQFLDILIELVFYPLLNQKDFEDEKHVIINEISSIKDNPDEYLSEYTEVLLYKGTPFERPISGTEEGIKNMQYETLADFYQLKYRPSNCIISLAGDIDKKEIFTLLSQKLPIFSEQIILKEPLKPEFIFYTEKIKQKTEQAYVERVYPGFSATDERRFMLSGLNMPFGSLMSSRLFVEAREKRGLCYSIESSLSMYKDTGYLSVFYNTSPKMLLEVSQVITDEAEKIVKFGVTEDEIETAVNQLKYSLLSGVSTVDGLMFRNLRNWFNFGRHLSIEETLEKINAINIDDVNKIAAEIFSLGFSECVLSR